MSNPKTPVTRARIVNDDGTPTREWYTFFNDLVRKFTSQDTAIANASNGETYTQIEKTKAATVDTGATHGATLGPKGNVKNPKLKYLSYDDGQTGQDLQPAQAGSDVTNAKAGTGDNWLPNGDLSSNSVGAPENTSRAVGDYLVDGWTVDSKNAVWDAVYDTTGSDKRILLSLGQSQTITHGAGYLTAEVHSAPIPAVAGDVIQLIGATSWTQTAALAAGLSGFTDFGLRYYDSTGTEISSSVTVAVHLAPGTFADDNTYTCPANTASVRVVLGAAVQNASGADINTGANDYIEAHYGHMVVRKNSVQTAGSGSKVGDERNLPSSLTMAFGAVISTTAAVLTGHSDGTVDVAAHTAHFTNSATASYGAVTGAVSGLAADSYHYIFVRDNFAGASSGWQSLPLSQANKATITSYGDAYCPGYVYIPTSGSSGGTNNPKLG